VFWYNCEYGSWKDFSKGGLLGDFSKGAKSGEISFFLLESRKQPFLANIFKIQGDQGLSLPLPSGAHECDTNDQNFSVTKVSQQKNPETEFNYL